MSGEIESTNLPILFKFIVKFFDFELIVLELVFIVLMHNLGNRLSVSLPDRVNKFLTWPKIRTKTFCTVIGTMIEIDSTRL
jgi:hypothetical protein